MASFVDKFKLKTASGKKTKKNLDCQHITTSDFMQFGVAYYRHLIPGEKLVVNMMAQARLAPMALPTFGNARLNCRAFFVPYRTLWPAWTDFIEDAVHSFSDGNTIPASAPYVRNSDLARLFTETKWGTLVDPSDPTKTYDVDYLDENGTERAILFTPLGRQLYKIVSALGYKICFDLQRSNAYAQTRFSALPLLAFVRVYLDWYFPSAYYQSYRRSQLESLLTRNTISGIQVSSSDLVLIMETMVFVNYDSDYFTAAFDQPTGPNLGAATDFEVPNVDAADQFGTGGGKVFSYSDEQYGGVKENTPYVSFDGSLSQFALDSLRKLTNYMKRHQLAGARALDRYLARFGVSLSAEKLNRSNYLGKFVSPLEIGDVMSFSSTEDAELGAYAGKGRIAPNTGHFEFETDEFGVFLIVSSIVPAVQYTQGLDRNTMHISKLDFWTPEFDGLGTQPILKGELILPNEVISNNTAQEAFNGVFGFTPRYAEMKVARDWLTGDFTLRSLNNAGLTSPAWHFGRMFESDVYADPAKIVHSEAFVSGQDSSQFNRIFYNTENTADHFVLCFYFKVDSWSPSKPLFDDYTFHDDDGKQIIMESNGVKVN